MFVYQLSLIYSLLLSDAFSQEPADQLATDVEATDDAKTTEQQAQEDIVSEGTEEQEKDGPSAQDLATFRQTVQRYTERMQDFRDETMILVEMKKTEALEDIRSAYSEPLLALEQDKLELRETAVVKFEQFIKKYPNNKQGAEIRFQLAEIYFDEALEQYLADQEEYDRLADENPDLEMDVLADLAKPIKLYREIIDKFPKSDVTDGALYMMGYCLGNGTSKQHDDDQAIGYYLRLVEDYPDSDFAAQANYIAGEYYFARSENRKALEYYAEAVRLSTPTGDGFVGLYEYALYALAWSYYRIDDYQNSLALFTKLQDYSARKEREQGQPVAAMEESLEYTAFSFIDIADDEGSFPLDVAKRYYKENGDRDYSTGVYVAMADILTKQKRNYEAVDVYHYLQEKWPYAPENPEYQHLLARLLFDEGDETAYKDALKELTVVYAENGEWWRQNRNNPEAQDVARGYIKDLLLDVAYAQYNEAFASQAPEDFEVAAKHFADYLTKFPFAEDFYVAQWYMADSLINSNKPEEALAQYEQLIKSADDHNYGELAKIRRLTTAAGLTSNILAGDFSQLHSNAEVVQKELLGNGTERLIYKLHPMAQTFISTYEAAKTADFDYRVAMIEEEAEVAESSESKEELMLLANEVANAQKFYDESLKSWEYNIGQLYFAVGDFENARERFNNIIDSWSDSIEAEYAANLVITSYQTQLNWEKVQQEAERFLAMQLGTDGQVDAEQFAAIIQNARLNLVQNVLFQARALMKEGKVQEGTAQLNIAAEGYEQYLKDYNNLTEDEYANILLLTANTYGDAGNIAKANVLNRQYVNRFPQRKESRSILFTIATNHQDALELEEAIKYYDILYNQTYGRGEAYEDAITAKYNSAILKVGLGDYRGAAKDLEFYVKKFPDLPNAELIFFSAGEFWEKDNDYRALEFYTRYLKKYQDQDPDRTMLAHYRRIKIYEKQGKDVYLKKEWKELMKAYERLLAKGHDTALMRGYASEHDLAEIPIKLATFKDKKYGRDERKNAELLVAMQEELRTLQTECLAYGEKYQDLSALLAGRYCVGSAELYMAKFIRAFPIDHFPWEVQVEFEEQLENQFKTTDMEDGAVVALEQVIDLSKKKETWTEWTDLALKELAEYDPKNYPPEKLEIRFQAKSNYVPALGPISIEVEQDTVISVEEEAPAPMEEGNLEMENAPENDANDIEQPVEDLPNWGGEPQEEPNEEPKEEPKEEEQ